MPTHKSWMDLPEYQFVESNPNPKMRPSVDLLMSKLRKLSNLKGHPEAVELIVHDLLYQFFFNEEKRPEFLFRIMMQADHLWRMALGSPYDVNRTKVEAAQSYGITPHLENGPKLVSGDVEGNSSKLLEGQLWSILAEDEAIKIEVAKIIADHRPHMIEKHKTLGSPPLPPAQFYCSCERKKPFESIAKWGKHVRIQIWRYLEGELRERPADA